MIGPSIPRHFARPARGQIIVLMAFGLAAIMGLVGAGVDYGFILIEDNRIQNALDVASLAGARSLVAGSNPGTTSAQSAAASYLTFHGYADGVNNTTITYSFPA